MPNKNFIAEALVCLLVLCSAPSFGQLQKVFHQTIALEDISDVQMDLYGDYTVEAWAGDNILIETNVKLYQASDAILNFFIEQGRYAIESDTSNATTLRLFSKDKERRTIKTRNGECFEVVENRIYLPDDFTKSGDHGWVRTKREDEEKNEERD